jgi:hypothetical protein
MILMPLRCLIKCLEDLILIPYKCSESLLSLRAFYHKHPGMSTPRIFPTSGLQNLTGTLKNTLISYKYPQDT